MKDQAAPPVAFGTEKNDCDNSKGGQQGHSGGTVSSSNALSVGDKQATVQRQDTPYGRRRGRGRQECSTRNRPKRTRFSPEKMSRLTHLEPAMGRVQRTASQSVEAQLNWYAVVTRRSKVRGRLASWRAAAFSACSQ